MKKLLTSLFLSVILITNAQAEKIKTEVNATAFDKAVVAHVIGQSIQRFPLAEDVTFEDAIDSMKLRASMIGFKEVADLPLSEEVKAKLSVMGKDNSKVRKMRILAFCDAMIAAEMVDYNIIFAGFLPCRIAAVEDENKKGWLVTMNMDMMLHAVDLPPHLTELAKKVRDNIYDIVEAGVNGEL